MPSHATLFINAKNTLKKLQSSANIDREYLTLRKQPTTDPPPNSELPTETHPPGISRRDPVQFPKNPRTQLHGTKNRNKKLRTVTKSSHTPSSSSPYE